MGNPIIFSGRRAKMLTADGLLKSNGAVIDYDGLKNYISNGHFEVNTAGWSAYNNGAVAVPTTGTGGTPTITLSRQTPGLYGTGMLRLTKPGGSSAQGQGMSYDFFVPIGSSAQMNRVSFTYQISNGTGFAPGATNLLPGTLVVYLYNVTTGTLIQPSTIFLGTGLGQVGTFNAEFQTTGGVTGTGQTYRLIAHIADANTNSGTIDFSDVKVGPTQYAFGPAVTDTRNMGTMTVTADTTAPTKGTTVVDRIWMTKQGNRAILDYELQFSAAGSAGSGEYIFALPTGMSFDTNFLTPLGSGTVGNASSAVLQKSYIGEGAIYSGSGTARGFVKLFAFTATTFKVAVVQTFVDYTAMASGFFNFANPMGLKFTVSAPILGWSSSVQMSDSADTRVIDAVAVVSVGTALTANTTNIPLTILKDSHSAWNGTGYVVPVSGDYDIAGSIVMTAANSATIAAYVNGTKVLNVMQGYNNQALMGATTLYNLTAGQVITLRSDTALTTLATALNAVTIARKSGPSAIAATETIAASYWCSANTNGSTTLPINFDSKEYDSHGAVTTGSGWRFTAPAAGIYSVNAMTSASSNILWILYKNGVAYKSFGGVNSSTPCNQGTDIKLLAGEYFDIRPTGSIAIFGGALATNSTSNINIKRTGSY